MSKTIPLDILSNIKNASPSKSVEKLLEIIKKTTVEKDNCPISKRNAICVSQLREDLVKPSQETERKIIIENFPKQKDNYLVVSKIIEK